jgi:DNA-binding IclR family transcriptional regulator
VKTNRAATPRPARPKDEQGTQAVQRALRLLGCFRIDRPLVSLTEFADEAGLTTPTAHRIVKALQARGYLVQDQQSRLYSLGPTVMRLAQVTMQRDTQHELVRLALPHLEAIRDATGETASLQCPIDMQCMCAAEVPSKQMVCVATGLGNVTPIYTGAAGKVILAWSSPIIVERAVAQMELLPNGTAAQARMRRELPWTRKKGYALSLGETLESASAIAVPVFSSTGVIAGAITVAGPIERWTRDSMLDHARMLTAVGATLSATFGYAGTPDAASL